MAAKKRTTAAPAIAQHQRESDYLSHAQKKVFARPTPRVAKVAPSEASAKKTSARKATTKAPVRKRAATRKTVSAAAAAAEK